MTSEVGFASLRIFLIKLSSTSRCLAVQKAIPGPLCFDHKYLSIEMEQKVECALIIICSKKRNILKDQILQV